MKNVSASEDVANPLINKHCFVMANGHFLKPFPTSLNNIELFNGLRCHNPTNNPKHLKTIYVKVIIVSVWKPHPITTTHGKITIRAVLADLVNFPLLLYLLYVTVSAVYLKYLTKTRLWWRCSNDDLCCQCLFCICVS